MRGANGTVLRGDGCGGRRARRSDAYREFFKTSFGVLMDRIFNFQEGRTAWLQEVSQVSTHVSLRPPSRRGA